MAGAGITVAKHGNRSVSSACGSADVLEALGVNIDVGVAVIEECLHDTGIGFLFAPKLHNAMKHAATPRRELGFRTIFNMLGPLTNPAGATSQLIGVYEPQLTEMFVGVLKNLGTQRAFVVHGSDGLDEATVRGETRISELNDGIISTYNINYADYVGEVVDYKKILGGTAEKNSETVKSVLLGDDGAHRKIVLLNSALAIVAGGKASTIGDGIKVAEESIDSGSARKKLQALIRITNS